jgi:hypothetical protein
MSGEVERDSEDRFELDQRRLRIRHLDRRHPERARRLEVRSEIVEDD